MKMIFGAPQYYVQGPDILKETAEHLRALGVTGRKVLVLIDPGVRRCVQPMLESLDAANFHYDLKSYEDSVHLDRIAAFIETLDRDYECVIGAGGGKAIDTAKRVKWALGCKLVTIPTSIATDACTSRTAVAYGAQDQIVEDKTLFNPDGVIADTRVLVNAPMFLFAAGLGDAISKRYEYLLAKKNGQGNWYDAEPAFFIDTVSREMHEFLLKNGRYLKNCFENHIVNDTVEKGITAMFLMSRLVWDAGGLRGAHDMFEEYHDAGYGDKTLHGNVVGFFDLVQMLLEGYPENEFEELYALYKEVGVPTRISEMTFPVDDEKALDDLAERMLKKCANFAFYPTKERFIEVIKYLEAR